MLLSFRCSFRKKSIVKEFKARWRQNDNIWYIVHNKDEDDDATGCFGDINIIAIFNIKEMRHKYYAPDSDELNEFIEYAITKKLINK